MKIIKIVYNELMYVDIHGQMFQISKVWKYASISKLGMIMLFKNKPTLVQDFWISNDSECYIAEVEYDGDFKTSLIKLKEE